MVYAKNYPFSNILNILVTRIQCNNLRENCLDLFKLSRETRGRIRTKCRMHHNHQGLNISEFIGLATEAALALNVIYS